MKVANELKAILQEMEALMRERTRAEAAYGFWCNADCDNVEAQTEFANAVLDYGARLEKVVQMQARLITALVLGESEVAE
jgi:anthranilate phosphoribosyltransferase